MVLEKPKLFNILLVNYSQKKHRLNVSDFFVKRVTVSNVFIRVQILLKGNMQRENAKRNLFAQTLIMKSTKPKNMPFYMMNIKMIPRMKKLSSYSSPATFPGTIAVAARIKAESSLIGGSMNCKRLP